MAKPKAKPDSTQKPEVSIETTDVAESTETALVAAEPEQSLNLVNQAKYSNYEDLYEAVSDEFKEKIDLLVKKFSSDKRGLHADEEENTVAFKPQIVKIHQPTTGQAPDASRPGDMITSTNGHIGKTFNFQVLSFWKERIKWPEGDTISDQPQCKSVDGVNGLWERREWRKCSTCPYKSWTTRPDDASKGYFPCKESVNMLTIDEDYSDFYRVQFASSNASTGKKFYNMVKSHTSEVFDTIWSLTTQKNSRYPTHEYVMPSKVRGLKSTDDEYLTADYFLDLTESARIRRSEAQKRFMEVANELASGGMIPDVESSDEAAPNYAM